MDYDVSNGSLIGMAVVGFVIKFIIASFFIWFASKSVRAYDTTFKTAITISFWINVSRLLITLFLGWIPNIGSLLALIVSIWVSLSIIKAAYETTGGQTFVIFVFYIIALFLALGIFFMLGITSVIGISI